MANTSKITNLQGEGGGEYYDDTNEHTGEWIALKAIGANAVFSAISSKITNLPAAHTITQDDVLYARVKSFTLASGAVIAYRASAGQPTANS